MKRLYAWRHDKPVAFDVIKEWPKQADIQQVRENPHDWCSKHRIKTAEIGTVYFDTPEAARDAAVVWLDQKIEFNKADLQRLRSLRGTVENWKAPR